MAEVAKREQAAALMEVAIPRVMVSEAVTPADTRILARGNWMDDSGEIVAPAIPGFLGKLDNGGRTGDALDLANWLVRPDNPLTARVTVNRLWRQFFGTGLSKCWTISARRASGPRIPNCSTGWPPNSCIPSTRRRDAHAWDVKHVIRTIVTSQTYRQSSMSTAELDERDPDNRLLARQSRFRVEAEVVRDIALSVSGLLVEKFGGPSAKPYEPDGYLATLNFPKREYAASRGDDLYRRGVYTFWQRSFLHPSLLTFDAPTREECTVNRVNSNTPLQALVLLNDPIYVEAARVFAQNILQHGRDWNARIDWAFERAAGRAPVAEERSALTQSLRQKSGPVSALARGCPCADARGRSPVAASAGRRTGGHDDGGARHSEHARDHYQNWNMRFEAHDERTTKALSTYTAALFCATVFPVSDCSA